MINKRQRTLYPLKRTQGREVSPTRWGLRAGAQRARNAHAAYQLPAAPAAPLFGAPRLRAARLACTAPYWFVAAAIEPASG